MRIKRIRIVGGPGCGKTHVSEALSKKLKIAIYDLDDLYWGNEYEIKADPKIRDTKLSQIVRKKEWIIEGVYGDWTEPTFKEADLIIILQPNKIARNLRITKRFFKRKLGFEKNKKKSTWKNLFELFKWSWRYDKNKFPGIYKQLQQHENKIVKITKSRVTADKILDLIKKRINNEND